MNFPTDQDIATATTSEIANVKLCAHQIMNDLVSEGIADFRAMAGALATVAVENHFRSMRETGPINYFKKYDGQYGNNQPGDGYKYRGGGIPQLTFKDNYAKYSKVAGVDLVAYPDKILDPAIGSKVFVAFFTDHGMDIHSARGNWRKVRRIYNGGLAHFADFNEYVYNLLDLFY